MDQFVRETIKRYSSSVGKNVMYLCFNAKYSHKIFERTVKRKVRGILRETAEKLA